jgi:hypothetical protein
VTVAGGHFWTVKDGRPRQLHSAACWCWSLSDRHVTQRPALRGPITPGDARVPRVSLWRYLLGAGR